MSLRIAKITKLRHPQEHDRPSPQSNTRITQAPPENRGLSRRVDNTSFQREAPTPRGQLDLFLPSVKEVQEPAQKLLPGHPLIAKSDRSAYHYWGRDRFAIFCAFTGKKKGYPFYQHEVDFILSRFRGWRSPVDDAEFWAVAKAASKLPKGGAA